MKLISRYINAEQLQSTSLLLVVLTMCLPIPINNVCIILALLLQVIHWRFNTFLQQAKHNKVNILFVCFFLICLFSAWHSNQQDQAAIEIEKRLLFIIFPVIITGVNKIYDVKRIERTFAVATTIAILYCIIIAVINYSATHQTDVFFYHKFSNAIHFNAIYLSMYAVFGVFICLVHYRNSAPLSKKILAFCCIILFIGVILLNSKNMLFVLLAGMLWITVQFLAMPKKWLFVLPIILIVLSLINPVRQRFITELKSDFSVVKQDSFRYDTPFSGATLRLVLWKNSLLIIEEQNAWITGIGLGDFQSSLNQLYQQTGMYTGNPKLGDTGYLGYNPHNFWVEVFLFSGLVGLLICTLIVVFLAYQCIRTRLYLGILLIFIFLSLSVTECLLSTNKGIVFFTFFFSLYSSVKIIKSR
ncbi:MAG: O-antigen ligase family protein [Bacteroidia bacterium]|jgi:O-antigen ligase|nr:O-antigen ligase family protein [Bacteroidia bacterium]